MHHDRDPTAHMKDMTNEHGNCFFTDCILKRYTTAPILAFSRLLTITMEL